MLVTENPYQDRSPCYMNDIWVPRTFPLKAEYNDYGSVENVEDGPARALWMEGLKRDLVELGWGDNSCHDVPTSKDMSFDALLNALQERRVFAQKGYVSIHSERLREAMLYLSSLRGEETKDNKTYVQVVPKGIPTLRRASKFLTLAGLPIYDGKQGSYMVDEIHYGFVRVRYQDWGADATCQVEKLKLAQEALRLYASMIVPGSGISADHAELILSPRPSTSRRRFIHQWVVKEEPKGLLVEQCMILEDVWQAMLKYKVGPDWGSESDVTVKDYRNGIRKFVEARKAKLASTKKSKSITHTLSLAAHHTNQELMKLPGVSAVHNDRSATLDISENLEIMLGKDAIPESFVDTVAEFAFVKTVLGLLRWYWRPSYSIGPQFNGWVDQKHHMMALKSIATKRAKKEMSEDED